ncbi:uncharacterized protein FMAN_06727 [Fusarium mangiferae]|uniref:F-box domain-containing protein n=1 Tax=Fusarium mangiferae TaxID=192010 RepID=A0A1L7SS08_FUSMA|nr:uncharacterized protein FMAN_06727 [Fusarium mangiferae]CVK85718.1 uncharacterized protein FMAN_06727 [Fusarium mangiferae]
MDRLVTPKTPEASEEPHTEGPVAIIQHRLESSTDLFVQPTISHKYQTTKAELEPEWPVTPKNLSPSENPHTHGPVNAIKEKLDEPLTASKLAVLPEEIILNIINLIYEGTDQQSRFAFFVLRQVSRQFRRLTKDKMFLSHPFSDRDCCAWCVGYKTDSTIARLKHSNWVFRKTHCFERKTRCEDTTRLANLVRKDKICEECQVEVDKRQRRGVSLTCKFAARDNRDWVYCSICYVEHPSSCFSREELQKESNRACIAKTGYVRLCEHKVLFWYDLKHQAMRPGGFDEIQSCRHPSHLENDLRHNEFPTAKLVGSYDGILSLSLSLTVVSAERCQTLMTGQNSSVAADQVLEAIESVRRHGAQCILPERNTKAPPEMDAFVTPDIHAGEEGMWTPIRKWPKHGELKDRDDWGKRPNGLSVFCEPRHYGLNQSTTRLCFLYERKIRVRNSDWNGPSHDWYHAISPESYTYSGPPGVPGTCSSPSCRNYYSFTTNSKRHKVSVWRRYRISR